MGKSRNVVATYALAHLVVDFACAFLMFQKLSASEQWYLCLLLYNFCAFALQMPLGLLADKWNRNALCAALGCALVALGYGFGSIPIAAAVVAGVGNALFHVGGGLDVLNVSGEKSSASLGVFVSPGALGIYLGTMLGKQGGVPVALVVIALCAAAGFILAAQYLPHKSFVSGNVPVSFATAASPAALIAIACLFFVVCLRSYVGMSLNFAWKGQGAWGVVLVCGIVLGKTAGGFLADKFGAAWTSVVSLGLAALLFLLSAHPLAGVGALFLFNMTMPITLWAMARMLPGGKGFSFGLLTFGLFGGFLPGYLGFEPLLGSEVGFALAALASIALLFAGLRRTSHGDSAANYSRDLTGTDHSA